MIVLKICGSSILVLLALAMELTSKLILVIGSSGMDAAILLMKLANRLTK